MAGVDPFAGMVADLFASVLAVDAVYEDGGGVALPTRAIVRAGVASSGLFDRDTVTETILIELLSSAVAAPGDGDTVMIGARVYTIVGTPKRSTDGLIWACDTDGGAVYAP